MSNYVPMQDKKIKPPADGVVFGGAETIQGEKFCLYLASEKSLAVNILISTYFRDWVGRMKLSEMRKLYEVLGKAIKFLEDRDGG